MPREYALLLRGISNVRMEPYREALRELGLDDVASFGGTGNFAFNATDTDPATLERAIGEQLGTTAFVRTRRDLARIVSANPYRDVSGSGMLFLGRAPTAPHRRVAESLDIVGEPLRLVGRTVYWAQQPQLRGKRGYVDLERVLDTRGTLRATHVVESTLAANG